MLALLSDMMVRDFPSSDSLNLGRHWFEWKYKQDGCSLMKVYYKKLPTYVIGSLLVRRHQAKRSFWKLVNAPMALFRVI